MTTTPGPLLVQFLGLGNIHLMLILFNYDLLFSANFRT